MISLLCQDAPGRGSVGGAWQSFCYDEQCQVWIRNADVRHALSTLFTPSFYDNKINEGDNTNSNEIANRNENGENSRNGGNGRIDNTDNRWIEKLRNGVASTSFSTSLEGQQSVAARWSGISLSEVLDIARLGLNQDNSQNYTSIQSKTPLHNGTQMLDWSAMVTASYLEEKIVLSYAVGTVEEASEWVAQWCRSNCLVSDKEVTLYFIPYLCPFSFVFVYLAAFYFTLFYFYMHYSIFIHFLLFHYILLYLFRSYSISFYLI